MGENKDHRRSLLFLRRVATVLLLVSVLLLWQTSIMRHVRVRYAVRQVHGLEQAQISWNGEVVVVRGRVKDESAFVELSLRLARIVGSDYVINETRIRPSIEPSVDPQQHIGILTIPINSRYDDSAESVKQISTILQLPQFETINVPTDATLSSVIFERYRFGPSDLPHSYDLLAHRIEELNGMHDTDKLRPGALKIPILPPRAQERLSVVAIPRPGIAAYSWGPGLTSVILPSVIERAVMAPGTEWPEAISTLSVPVTGASLAETKSVLRNSEFGVDSLRMTVRFAERAPAAGGNIHKTLTPQEFSLLLSGLSRKPHRNATVFILDDGWPDQATYSQSVDEVQRLSDVVRHYYGLPLVILQKPPFVPLPAQSHSSSIRDALKEFTDADKLRIVKVVYVPLSRAQNSAGILQEILWLHFIASRAKSLPLVSDSLINAANNNVSEVLTNIQASYDDQKIATDEAVLRAVWSIADFVSKQSMGRDVFFINESWTVISDSMPDPYPGPSAGIAVAAVGNLPGKVVNSDIEGVDFARRCTSTKSVLAVLNVIPRKDKDIACNSSIVKKELIDDAFAAAYDGEVLAGPNETDCLDGSDMSRCVCGTSFAAPRISWILALSEALRSADIEYTDWNSTLLRKVRTFRTNGSIHWSDLYLHPDDYTTSQ